MVDPAKRRATYGDLLEVPGHLVAEIIHGTLVTQPRPAPPHARAASRQVLSPSTAATDRADKVPIYAAERVPHVWLIDPLVRTLEVHRLDGDTYRVVGVWRDAAIVRAEPFDALELELASLWAD